MSDQGITNKQRAALRRFANENGPNWRARLTQAWWVSQDGGFGFEDLRRTHGTKWLQTYDILEKDDEAEEDGGAQR